MKRSLRACIVKADETNKIDTFVCFYHGLIEWLKKASSLITGEAGSG